MVAQRGRGGGPGNGVGGGSSGGPGPGNGASGGSFGSDSQGNSNGGAVIPTRVTTTVVNAPPAASAAAPPANSPNTANFVPPAPPQRSVAIAPANGAGLPASSPSTLPQSTSNPPSETLSTSPRIGEILTTAVPVVEPDVTSAATVNNFPASTLSPSTFTTKQASTFLTKTTSALSTLDTASPTASMPPVFLIHQPSNHNARTAGIVAGVTLFILFLCGLIFFLFRRRSSQRERPESGTTWSETTEKTPELPPFVTIWRRVSFALSFDNLSRKSSTPVLNKNEDFYNRPLSVRSAPRSQIMSRIRSGLGSASFVNGNRVTRSNRSAAKPFESPQEFAAERMPSILTPPPQDIGPPTPQLLDVGSLLRTGSLSSKKSKDSEVAAQEGSQAVRLNSQDYFHINPTSEKSFIESLS